MIPEDSRVEIDAKINAGYFTTGAQVTEEQLKQVKGRGWEKWEDIAVSVPRTARNHASNISHSIEHVSVTKRFSQDIRRLAWWSFGAGKSAYSG